jgi:hypothetical protein
MSVSQNFQHLNGQATIVNPATYTTPPQTVLKLAARPISARGTALMRTPNAQNPKTTPFPLVRGNASNGSSQL